MMPTQLLCAKQLVEGLLVPLVTDSLKKSFDRNLIIKLKQFEVPLAVQGQARWVMTRCRQCANLYLHEEGTILTRYIDPEEGEMELEIYKFGLYPIRSIKEHEPLRWHVGNHDIHCDDHLDPDARRLIIKHPEIQSPHHDCYTDFIAEHNIAEGVQLLRPLIHGTLFKSKHTIHFWNPDPEKQAESILLDGQRFQLERAAADARVRCRQCANTAVCPTPPHRYDHSVQLELITIRSVAKGEAVRWWVSDGCGEDDICADHRLFAPSPSYPLQPSPT